MITKEEIDDLKLEMKNVPFGNSVFQNQNFTAGQEISERRYRHLLLQVNQKLNALKECEFRRKRLEIDIKELDDKFKTAGQFEKERFDIDIEEKTYCLENEIKLIEDCLIEIEIFKRELDTLPKFTREQFEIAEYGYWKQRLLGDAQREVISMGTVGVGTIASLENIGIKVGRNEQGQVAYEEVAKHDNLLS